MSFFELDGGNAKKAKPKAKKSMKSKAKKDPAKKSSGKKKTKKGGNFLGTVSELFAPAGWESFVTAAGLLALDRTDNFLRKSKDSKKQKGGADDTPKMEEEMTGGARKRSSSRKHRGGADDTPKMEEEMTGGVRKRSSSRKQRGGSDGHHTVEALDAMMGSEELEMTGGAKKRSSKKPKTKSVAKKGKGRKQKGGAMTEDQKTALYEAYLNSQSPNKNSQNENTYNSFISNLLQSLGVEANPTNVEEAKLVIDYKKKPNENQSKANAKNRLNAFYEGLSASTLFNANTTQPIPIPEGNRQTITNNRTLGIMPNNTPRGNANAVMPSNSSMLSNNSLQFPMSPVGQPANNTPSSYGGKPKSKSSSKKPKAKKPKTKAKKAPKRK